MLVNSILLLSTEVVSQGQKDPKQSRLLVLKPPATQSCGEVSVEIWRNHSEPGRLYFHIPTVQNCIARYASTQQTNLATVMKLSAAIWREFEASIVNFTQNCVVDQPPCASTSTKTFTSCATMEGREHSLATGQPTQVDPILQVSFLWSRELS